MSDQGRQTVLSADLVIRFNDCRSAGEDAWRTDVVAVPNSGIDGKAIVENPSWVTVPGIAAAAEIWCVRDPVWLDAIRPEFVRAYPGFEDMCIDYSGGIQEICDRHGKRLRILSAATHQRLDEELAAFSPPPYAVPSSGLIVAADVLWNVASTVDRIVVAGFSHQGSGEHPWVAEEQWVDRKVAEGKLFRDTIPPARPTLVAPGP
ncbi:Urease operon accessory protein [Labrys wisconsinensis]|uniref:Uncharacterized protein n=1 Tax=Labrys wisconsinensis TaxID=425677 RepID=A0ABU0JHX1_9HYPH|nr:Urease operon accessory protein [Labrys wisconsinensis]MDQ0473888.1 hypothetical protein [Labrys wisconsinensis]